MSESLTYAFSDADGGVCGIARFGRSDDGESGLVLVFRGGEPVAVKADGAGTAGLSTEELEGDRWRVTFDGDVPFDLEFAAVGDAIVLDASADAAKAGGMEGSDHVCRVTGTVGGAPFAGLGQRGRAWGDPDWDKMLLARTIGAWFDDGRALTAVAIRPEKAASHADEHVSVTLLDADGAVVAVEMPRISTTYDAEERQRAAGLELYVGEEDEFALRAAGEVVAGTSLDLGRLRLDCAFFRWRMQGHEGVGRYDVLRRIA